MLGLSLVLCVPWLAYTASETGRVLVWGNSGSLSTGCPPPSPAISATGSRRTTSSRIQTWRRTSLVFERLRGLELPEQNAELERRAVENIVSNPLKYENIAANVSRMFFDAPYSYTEQRLSAVFFALPNALLLSVALLAAVGAYRMRESLPAAAVPFAAFALVSFGLHALVAAYPRMLMPIVPVVVWFAATVGENVRLARPTVQGSCDAADEGGDRGGAEMTTDAGAGSCGRVRDERASGRHSRGRARRADRRLTLQELGETGWQTFEREDRVGGRSLDRGRRIRSTSAHILFAADPEIGALIRDLLGTNFVAQSREAFIYHLAHDLYTRFPFQAHLHGLPAEIVVDCLAGLVRAVEGQARGELGPRNYEEWMRGTFGTASPST